MRVLRKPCQAKVPLKRTGKNREVLSVAGKRLSGRVDEVAAGGILPATLFLKPTSGFCVKLQSLYLKSHESLW